jgi:capsular exopolysaccharide synthesis family protein
VIGGGLTSAGEHLPAHWDGYEAAEPSTEQTFNVLEYLRIALKYKWLIAICVIGGLAVGFAVTALTTPTYTAASTIQIEREAPKVISIGGVEAADQQDQGPEFFETQYGLMKSRSLAERVAQSLGLAADNRFLSEMGAIPKSRSSSVVSGNPAARERWIAGILESHLGVSPVRDSRLVKITFDSPDPGLSAQVANAFADNYIASNLERKYDASSYARQFLEQRIAELKTKLEDSERQLVAYATQQRIITLTEGGSNNQPEQQESLDASDLGAFNAALVQAKANRIQAEVRWRATQTNSGLSVPEIIADPTIQTLRQSKASLTAQYQNQLKTFKPDYPDMLQLKGQINQIDQEIQAAADTIRNSLKTQYLTDSRLEDALEGKVDQLKGSVLNLRTREIQYNILQREVDTNRTLYEGLLQRYKEIGVAGGLSDNNISIVDRAIPPGGPSKPQPMHNFAIAGISGLGLGIALAALLETLDQVIRKPSDIETKLGLPMLGTIPLLDKGIQASEALGDVRSAFSEAYHSVRSTLNFTTNTGAPRILAITSARPEEGKSTSALALAQGFGRLGSRVLLVDVDLRNPSVHKVIGADNRVGMSNLLTTTAGIIDAIQPTTWPNLFVIPSGPLPPSPAELLAGPRLKALVEEMVEQFDMVVLDGPPVMGLADAPLIASIATGTVVVIEAGHTTRAQAQSGIRRLRMANAHILGVILAKFDARKSSSTYGYGYGYGYSYEYDYDYGPKKGSTEAHARKLEQALQDIDRAAPPAA